MKAKHKWPVLVIKRWQGAISKADQAELDQHISDPLKKEQLLRFTSVRWMLNRLTDMHRFDKTASWNRILEKNRNLPESIALPYRVPGRYYWAAASILIGILFTGLILYFTFINSQADLAATREVTPKNETRLLWHDGTTIALENQQAGVLAQLSDAEVGIRGDTVYVTSKTITSDTGSHWNTLVNPKGKHIKLALPDGSTVSVDAASSVRFPSQFAEKDRTVEIEGQAFLDIAKNPAVPFIAKVSDQLVVKALGTSFIVRSYKDERKSSVTLISGRVAVSNPASPNKAMVIHPKEQYQIENGKVTVTVRDQPKLDVLSWETGQFNLNKNLHDILNDISIWYEIPVTYDTGVPNPLLHGYYERDQSLKNLLEFIAKLSNVKLTLSDNTITVSNK